VESDPVHRAQVAESQQAAVVSALVAADGFEPPQPTSHDARMTAISNRDKFITSPLYYLLNRSYANQAATSSSSTPEAFLRMVEVFLRPFEFTIASATPTELPATSTSTEWPSA